MVGDMYVTQFVTLHCCIFMRYFICHPQTILSGTQFPLDSMVIQHVTARYPKYWHFCCWKIYHSYNQHHEMWDTRCGYNWYLFWQNNGAEVFLWFVLAEL